MAYANVEDVGRILPPEEDVPVEESREWFNLTTALEEATDLVIGYLERTYTGDDEDEDGVPDDVPDAVRRVVARVTLREFLYDPTSMGAESEVELMGPFSHTVNFSKEYQSHDLFLTDMDKLRLEPYKAGYTGGVTNFPMAGACGTNWYYGGGNYGLGYRYG